MLDEDWRRGVVRWISSEKKADCLLSCQVTVNAEDYLTVISVSQYQDVSGIGCNLFCFPQGYWMEAGYDHGLCRKDQKLKNSSWNGTEVLKKRKRRLGRGEFISRGACSG